MTTTELARPKPLTRPRRAVGRVVPASAPGIEQMVRSLTRLISKKIEHLKAQPHDYRARQGLEHLFNQRGHAMRALLALDAEYAALLALELNLSTEVPHGVV